MNLPHERLSAGASTIARMSCPNCSVDLTSRKTSRGIMYWCPHCRGRALGLAVLRRTLGEPLANNVWSHAKFLPHDHGKICPSCAQPMAGVVTAAKHGKVNLDVCTRCQLAWFDPREFEDFPIMPTNHPQQLPLKTSEAIAVEEMRRDTERRRGPDYGTDDGPDESWKWIPALFGLPVEENSSIDALPWLTWGLSAVLVMTFFLTWSNLGQAVHQFGLIPAQAWRLGGATLLTSFFIHGSLLHLFGNVYFLLVFGDNVENDIGRWRYAALLLVATLAGNFAHIALDVRPNVPCVGASGGIAGVLAYYALRFPRARICMLIAGYYYLYLRWIHLPAYCAFGLWIAFQIVIAFVQTHAAGDVSGLAHLGGASVGFIAWVFRRVFVGESTAK